MGLPCSDCSSASDVVYYTFASAVVGGVVAYAIEHIFRPQRNINQPVDLIARSVTVIMTSAVVELGSAAGAIAGLAYGVARPFFL